MKRFWSSRYVLLVLLLASPTWGGDSWKVLQRQAGSQTIAYIRQVKKETKDPWAQLQAIYLPFSERQEKIALTNPAEGRTVCGHFNAQLHPFRSLIAEASRRFDIPPEIIGAVILVESSGNPRARARTSSAKGLMQTIDGTFRLARNHLHKDGISIGDSPFDPRASVLAGAWYLDRMYRKARADGKSGVGRRSDMASWRYPLEYYYAGPGNGKKRAPVVILYAGGRRVSVDKPAYSRKVLGWAGILRRYG
jgi:soluble lytic murein transglycosylase-like protein